MYIPLLAHFSLPLVANYVVLHQIEKSSIAIIRAGWGDRTHKRSGVVNHLLQRDLSSSLQNYLKMRRRTLPQGSPCGVEVSDLEIYLARSCAKGASEPLLDPRGR